MPAPVEAAAGNHRATEPKGRLRKNIPSEISITNSRINLCLLPMQLTLSGGVLEFPAQIIRIFRI